MKLWKTKSTQDTNRLHANYIVAGLSIACRNALLFIHLGKYIILPLLSSPSTPTYTHTHTHTHTHNTCKLLPSLPPSLWPLWLAHMLSPSLAHSLPPSLTLTDTHWLWLGHFDSLASSLTHSDSLIDSDSLWLTHWLWLTLTHSFTLTHSLTHSLTNSDTHTHTHTHTHNHSLAHSLTHSLNSLTLTHSFSHSNSLWLTCSVTHSLIHPDSLIHSHTYTNTKILRVLSHEATCPRNKITYMSHEVTCRCDMSPIIFPRVCSHRELWFIYRLIRATCCKCMSHEGTECAREILSPGHVTWIQTDLNSCDKSWRRIA